MPVLKKIASLAILALILGLAYNHISHFLKWPPAAYTDPGVFNLTQKQIEWEVHYGEPELCGKVECHLLEGYASANFEKRQVLPVREFPLKDYAAGQIIYYRTKIKIPEDLLREEQVLILHSIHIWAEKYTFYVNGRFVDSGAMDTFNIPIPRALIPESREISLMFRVDPGNLHYQGLAHMSDLLLGTKEAFAALQHASYDLRNGYYLWHLLPRLTVCLVFALFLLALARDDEIFMLVLYSFAGATYIYLVSDLPKVLFADASAKAWAAPVCNVASALLFFGVAHRFFRQSYGRLAKVAAAVGALILTGVVVAGFLIPVGKLHAVANQLSYYIRFAGSAYAVWLAVVTWRYLRATGKSSVRLRMTGVIFLFNVLALVVYALGILKLLPQGTLMIFVLDTMLMIVFSALVGHEYSTTIVQRDQMKNTFKRFIGAPVVDRLVHGSERPKPKEMDVSVMFCDIRSFTTMCESMSPGAVFDFLNTYLEMMVQVITQHGGLIDKFGGDSIMVVWGAPDPDAAHARHAAACALAMRAALAQFNQQRAKAGLSAVRIGIGIHSGTVISGAVGSDERQEFTVLGDTVNTAARIEGLTKDYGTDILISGATMRYLEGWAAARNLGVSQVKGRSEIVEVFALDALAVASAREAA